MGDVFAPWHIILLVIVLVLLFGGKRLPGAAKSLGESMHIFKHSVQGLHPEAQDNAAGSAAQPVNGTLPPPAAAPTLAAPPDATQQQLADLQQQLADLKRQQADDARQQASNEPAQPR